MSKQSTLDPISEERERLEVLDMTRLQDLGRFDGRYLNAAEALSQWEVSSRRPGGIDYFRSRSNETRWTPVGAHSRQHFPIAS